MLGVSKTDFDKLFNDYIEYTPPALETERILQFYRMVLLINVDLNVDSEELSHVKSAGLRLGLRAQAVDSVLSEMKRHERGIISENKLLEIFKAHYN